MTKPVIAQIVAVSGTEEIGYTQMGYQNDLLWKIPKDLAHFKKTTLHQTILMGRRTYESIGRPLPKRKNLVLTRNTNFSIEGATIVRSFEDALKETHTETLFICGGAEIYRQALPITDKIYLTKIHKPAEQCDTFYPTLNLDQDWQIQDKTTYPEENGCPAFDILTLTRKES